MKPILAIPFLTGLTDLERCLESIDIRTRVLIIDNSIEGVGPEDSPPYFGPPEGWDDGDHTSYVIELPHNLGVAATWNLAIKSFPHEPFWLIANHDAVFAPGDLDRLIEEMEKPGPRWVGMNGDWRVMGLNAECVERVGFFDENFVPIYCEDADYEYRCSLAGVPWYFIEGGATHVGSASIREPRYAQANARTYPENRAYYVRKWGGDVRGGEVFTTPFDRGGSIRDWTPDLSRLQDDWCVPDSRTRHAR